MLRKLKMMYLESSCVYILKKRADGERMKLTDWIDKYVEKMKILERYSKSGIDPGEIIKDMYNLQSAVEWGDIKIEK